MEGIVTRAPESIGETPRIESDSKKPKKSSLEKYTINLCEKAKAARLTRF